MRIQISGTWVATLAFLGSCDGGITFAPVDALIQGVSSLVQSVTSNGIFNINNSSLTHVLIHASAYTSGIAVISCSSSNSEDLQHVVVMTPSGAPLPVTVSSSSTSQTKAFDNTGTNNTTIYIGSATPGIAQSAAGWTIQLLGYDGNGNVNSITWGSVSAGVPASNLIWNNRASYTYS
jgi:hypothetical protein